MAKVVAHNGVGPDATNLVILTVNAVAPTAPTLRAPTIYPGAVLVELTPGTAGPPPTTSYTTDVTDPTHPTQEATAPGPEITITGLTNGHSYTVTATATSADGTSPPSAPLAALHSGIPSDPRR